MKAQLRSDVEEDSLLLSNTAADYARAVENEYGALFEGDTSCPPPSRAGEKAFRPNR